MSESDLSLLLVLMSTGFITGLFFYYVVAPVVSWVAEKVYGFIAWVLDKLLV